MQKHCGLGRPSCRAEMTIIVATSQDVHPKHQALNALLRRDVDVERMPLRYADYTWCMAAWPTNDAPTFGVEVNTVLDFIGKLKSGRLTDQVTGLLASYSLAAMIIKTNDGHYRTKSGKIKAPGRQSKGFPIVAYEAALMEMADVGVTPWFEDSDTATATRLLAWYKSHQKPWLSRTLFQPQYVRNRQPLQAPMDPHITYLAGTPPGLRIGNAHMTAALSAFGSIRAVINASSDDLIALPRWGKGTVENWEVFVSENGENGHR